MKLYLIGLCEDESGELDLIEGFLAKYWNMRQVLEYRVQRFTSAEELLWQIRNQQYRPNLLLLDIFMSGKTGMEAAEEIRRAGHDVPIVFLTASTEHALRAYEVDAVQYLVKPLSQERFFHAMDSAMRQVHKLEESQIVVKVAGGIRQIRLNEIIYCESQKNYQLLYLAGGECKARMTTGRLWEMLKRFSQFGRCSRSYILNMNHIVSVEREAIVMDNKTTIFIPRNKVAEFKKEYFSYYFGRKGENGQYSY